MTDTENEESIERRIIILFENHDEDDALTQEQIHEALGDVSYIHLDRILAKLCTPQTKNGEVLDAALRMVRHRHLKKSRYYRSW